MDPPCWHPAVLPLSFVGTFCMAWEDGMARTMSTRWNSCPCHACSATMTTKTIHQTIIFARHCPVACGRAQSICGGGRWLQWHRLLVVGRCGGYPLHDVSDRNSFEHSPVQLRCRCTAPNIQQPSSLLFHHTRQSFRGLLLVPLFLVLFA